MIRRGCPGSRTLKQSAQASEVVVARIAARTIRHVLDMRFLPVSDITRYFACVEHYADDSCQDRDGVQFPLSAYYIRGGHSGEPWVHAWSAQPLSGAFLKSSIPSAWLKRAT